LIADWLAQPHVARWWHHEFTTEAVERDVRGSWNQKNPMDGPQHLILQLDRPTTVEIRIMDAS
jgi:hypothetical protein